MLKKMVLSCSLMIFSTAMMSGCTSVKVKPLDAAGLKLVCIEENPQVIVNNFVPVVRDGFDRHGISTQVYSGEKPAQCEYTMTYTALRSWDFAPYLSHAELDLKKDGKTVASATYHLKAGGGFSLMKWQGVKTKMDPMIDELLKDYK